MKFLGLAAAVLTVTMRASASTLIVSCGGFSLAGTGTAGYFITANPVASGIITCTAPTLGTLTTDNGGVTPASISTQVILEADFGSGNPATNTTQTLYSANTLAILSDTLTVTGSGGSSGYGDSLADSGNAGGLGSSNFFDGSYSSSSLVSGTIDYSVNITAGSVQTVSGNVYEFIGYETTPEPATLGLVATALIGLGLLARKRVAR